MRLIVPLFGSFDLLLGSFLCARSACGWSACQVLDRGDVNFQSFKSAAFCTCPSLPFIFFCYFIITIVHTCLICMELVWERAAALRWLLPRAFIDLFSV